jgi:hypothetical protein
VVPEAVSALPLFCHLLYLSFCFVLNPVWLLVQALPNWEDLAAGVLSHLAGHDKRVCEVARDLHQRLKTNHSQRVPVVTTSYPTAYQVASRWRSFL